MVAKRGTSKASGKGTGSNMKPFYSVLILVAVIGAAALAYISATGAPSVVTLDPDLGPATAEGYVMGSPDALVEIVEFADFECPACGQFATLTAPDVKARLVDAGIVRYRFYDFPLAQHRHSLSAHLAAACAADQGKFWEMHDIIFMNQDRWTPAATSNPKRAFEGYASQIGLDANEFEACYDDRRHMARISANAREGERLGVRSTPTFIIGNRMYPGTQSYDQVKAAVDAALAEIAAQTVATGGNQN